MTSSSTPVQTLLVTGGLGFIGSNFVRLCLAERPGYRFVNLDAVTYAGNPENLADVADSDRYAFVRGSISDRDVVDRVFSDHPIDAVVNFAAESHVDRSIHDATPFVTTNILGTQVLLDVSRQHEVPVFVHVSTDEVYGSLGETGRFTEETPLAPNSPYAASKAGADCLVRAAHETYGMDCRITRCSNNYGPYQFPEKLIPLFLTNALADQPLPLYGTGLNVRDWIFVRDHCLGILATLEHGRAGEVYNFGGDAELNNRELTETLLNLIDKPHDLIKPVADRPGHDFRYAMDFSKATTELGWRPTVDFETGLRETIRWYRDHAEWIANVRSGEYRSYYEHQYGSEANS